MHTLEEILTKLMKIEDDIQAFCVILKALKVYHEEKNKEEINAIIWLTEKQIQEIEKQLDDSITKLDTYLLENK